MTDFEVIFDDLPVIGVDFCDLTIKTDVRLQDKTDTVTANGTYNYTPGTDYDGLSAVTVNVAVQCDLPTLNNPATAADITSGKQALDGDGNVLTGTFVDMLQYITTVSFASLADTTGELYLNLPNAKSLSLRYCDIGATKLTLVLSDKLTSLNQCFRAGNVDNVTEIELLGNIGGITKYSGAFSQRRKLVKITGLPLNFAHVTSCANCFDGCSNLVDVRFVEGSISISLTISAPNLSDDSVRSIIDGLADLTDKTAQTLSLHGDVKNKLTEAQKTNITNKNWTLA